MSPAGDESEEHSGGKGFLLPEEVRFLHAVASGGNAPPSKALHISYHTTSQFVPCFDLHECGKTQIYLFFLQYTIFCSTTTGCVKNPAATITSSVQNPGSLHS